MIALATFINSKKKGHHDLCNGAKKKALKCPRTFSHYFFDFYASTNTELFSENLVQIHSLTQRSGLNRVGSFVPFKSFNSAAGPKKGLKMRLDILLLLFYLYATKDAVHIIFVLNSGQNLLIYKKKRSFRTFKEL